jgi:hypothetical protein
LEARDGRGSRCEWSRCGDRHFKGPSVTSPAPSASLRRRDPSSVGRTSPCARGARKEALTRTHAHATVSSNGSVICRPKEYRAPATIFPEALMALCRWGLRVSIRARSAEIHSLWGFRHSPMGMHRPAKMSFGSRSAARQSSLAAFATIGCSSTTASPVNAMCGKELRLRPDEPR